ncbi:unnamed protein product, partial [Musa acuminata var. zebrina]
FCSNGPNIKRPLETLIQLVVQGQPFQAMPFSVCTWSYSGAKNVCMEATHSKHLCLAVEGYKNSSVSLGKKYV